MKEKSLTIPEIAQIAGTRVILGAGIGLLLADKLSGEQRRAVGWALLAVGALSTIRLLQTFSEKNRSRTASRNWPKCPADSAPFLATWRIRDRVCFA